MTAYYNEIDPKAAAWIRELIKQGLIAPGDVDERSIEDITPNEIRKYTQCHFFAGIAVWSHALRRAGWPDDRPVWTGSCPCQPFSAAGKSEGFDDERHLWPAWFHLIDELRPVTVFGEQVSSKDGLDWFDLVSDDMEGADYTMRALDIPASSVGAPHRRQRLYFVADARHAKPSGRLSHANRKLQQSRNELAPYGGSGELAESTIVRRRGRRDGDSPGDSGEVQIEGRSTSGFGVGLADTEGTEFEGHNSQERRPLGYSESCELADANGGDESDGELQRSGKHGQFEENSRAGQLGDTSGPRLERNQPELLQRGDRLVFTERGPTDGFWRDSEWIYCRDEKYRAVEPGTFPLVTGATARVGRLRGYGNSIVSPLAQAFIESYLDWEK